MNLSDIKKKYRAILEESEESNASSDDEKVVTIYEQMQAVTPIPLRRKRSICPATNRTSRLPRRTPRSPKEAWSYSERNWPRRFRWPAPKTNK